MRLNIKKGLIPLAEAKAKQPFADQQETTATCRYTQRPDWQTRLIALRPKVEVAPVRNGPFGRRA